MSDSQASGSSTSSPSASPTPNYPSPPSQTTALPNPYPQTQTRPVKRPTQASYAAVLQAGPSKPIPTQVPASQPAPTRTKAKEQSVYRGPKPGYVPAPQTGYNQYGTQQGSRTYAQAVQSPQASQTVTSQSQSARGPVGYGTSFPQTGQHEAFAQVAHPNMNQQLNGFDLYSMRNYRPELTETFKSVGDWVDQPRAAEDRLRPRLYTHLSAQSSASTHSQSFTASSQSPSTLSRTSTRRTRDQMMTGNHRCPVCGKAFDTAADLGHHSRYHQEHENRPFACRSCAARFIFFKDLQRHEPVHDPDAEKFYCYFPTCKYAEKGFGREDHLTRHLRNVHRVDPIVRSSGPSSQYGQ